MTDDQELKTDRAEDAKPEEDPWWAPRPCDPEQHQYGWRYDPLWDHIGDAYETYTPLADDWLRQRELIDELVTALKGVVGVADRDTVEFDAARAAIARATGGEETGG